MSQKEEKAPAQNLNGIFVITCFIENGTIHIVSIIHPDGKTRFFGNGIGKIVPDNHITRAGSNETPEGNRKQYTLRFENGKWNIYLDEIRVHTFDEIFGLPDGTSHLENVSFRQFKYVPTAVDETTETFRQLLGQLVSAYPDRFCLEDPAKKMEIRVGGTKVRIPKPIFELVKQLLVRFGISTCSFVEHLENGSENGVCRGDADLYVRDAKQSELIIEILTKLGFVKDSTDKTNDKTFRIYLDVLHQKISDEAIMPDFNLPASSDPSQYYIEVEIKIATEFQKAYESNCLGYFLGLLLSHYLKISTSGISLKHSCDEIPINVGSFDDFLKKLGINLNGIQTTREFIERLLASPLISELLTVSDILRIFKNIMGDEKMKHTSKPLREWLHLLLCGLKERFPFRSELIQEMIQDEKSGQMIPTWRIRLFVLNQGSECDVQMEKGVLFIMCSGKKLFVSTGDDDMSLIFSEKQLKSDSGKKPIPQSLKVCSRLFELLKDYFEYLKGINIPRSVIERFIDALGCHSEVCSHLGQIGSKIMAYIRDESMNSLYPVSRMKPASMNGNIFGILMKEFKPVVIDFSQFQSFCVERLGVQELNKIFAEYKSEIDSLTPEENKQKRREIYAAAIGKIEKLCLAIVIQWTSFHNSDVNWRPDEQGFFHIPSKTYHGTAQDRLPYYLGTSVFEGKQVNVFMDGQSGEIFTMEIAE